MSRLVEMRFTSKTVIVDFAESLKKRGKKMSDTEKLLNAALSLGSISVMAAASRTILSPDRRSLAGFLRGLVLAIFVAIVVGWGIDGSSISQEWKNVIIAVCAFAADDILLVILSVTTKLREDPSAVIDLLREYVLRILPKSKSGE
jgi:hypothetical protein